MTAPLHQEFEFLKKTGRAASFGSFEGRYPFFTSSQKLTKRTDVADCEGPALVFGTGGAASLHYVEGPFSATNDCYVAIPKSGRAEDGKFFYHYLRANLDLIESGFRGAGLKHVSKKHLEAIKLPVNPDTDRTKICNLLDKADGIRCKREQALILADDLLKSTFLEMFGDPQVNPNKFKVEEISTHLSDERPGTQSGPFGSALKKYEYTTSGIPVWGVENVQMNRFVDKTKLFISTEKYSQLRRYRVQFGDILISRAGTVGRMCIAYPKVEDSIISSNLVRVVLKPSLLAEYFVALFTYLPHRLGSLKANNKDSAFTFLNPKTLALIEIPIPPKSLQKDYRARVKKIESLTRHAENQHWDILQELFNSLTQRAFRGEL